MERPSVLHLIAQAAEEQWEELDLSEMDLTELPPEIGNLRHLKRLILGKWDREKGKTAGNQLTTVPQELWQLHQLEELNLSGNQLCEIPDEIAQLVNLKILDLDNNKITSLSDAIAQLINLETLYLDNSQLKILPDSISQLKNLRRFSLNNSVLTVIPEWISELINLTGLYLYENQIAVIPDWVGTLTTLTDLALSSNQLTEIPEAIASLTNLTSLALSSNQLTEIPEAIASLSNLTTLDLSSNQLTAIPEAIASLTNLTYLSLWSNQLTAIPEAIASLTNLTSLDLRSNQLTEIPEAIASLSNLTTLDLSSNQLTEIPEAIASLSNLTSLYLSSNQLTELPEAIASLSNLTTLDLRSNQLTELPEAIASLSNLTSLYLSSNQLTELPEAIASLSNLTSLYLSSNQLTEIPEAIASLSNLTTLYLSENQLTELPKAIASLTNLTTLYLSENQLTELPKAIASLSNLTSLDLRSNQLTEIPEAIASLSNLTSLDLRSNQLTEIPEAIASLSNLTSLDLRSNQLTELPEAIASLSNLTSLDLRSNQLTELPEAIASLSNLTSLDLRSNQLTELPEAIASLSNLTSLYLRSNQLTELPEAIASLSKLENLDLRRNPINIPSEILAPTEGSRERPKAKPILDYYFATRDPDQTHIFYEAKLLLVGEGGAGKTSLANKILNADYKLKPETENTSTQGIDILDWEFIGTNGNAYKIHIWDFGGQDIYHSTHQFFLTERACYLLVADDRKENTDHYFWLQSIQLLSKNSPVYLIQNEKGGRLCTLNANQLRGEFENLRDAHRTNLSNNSGLDTIRLVLQREIETLIPDGIRFPYKWLDVRYSLENDGRNYIDNSEYEATCRRHGITGKDEMQNLSRFLHELGIVLHFQKDFILSQRLILKPNWGTTAIYKILDNPTVKSNLGQFADADLEHIWADKEYADMRYQLLQLMKEFKVCYEIPRRKGHYIAPHLLSPETPAYSPLITDHSLILRYRYTGFMPKGILTRFIVEMHKDIENVSDPSQAAVWKNGVVLNKRAARAEVIEHYIQREIYIRVSGNRPRDLLTLIHDKFEDIHEQFYGEALSEQEPPYQTLIPCNCPTCKPSADPYTFPLNLLQTWLDEGRFEIQCYRKGANVRIRSLIDDVMLDDLHSPEDSPEDFSGKRDRNRVAQGRSRRKYTPSATPVIIENHNHIHNINEQAQSMTNESKYSNDLKGANIGNFANEVTGNARQQTNQHNYAAQQQNLAEAAKDIKALIDQLSTDYDTTTPSGKRKLTDRVLETLEGNTTIQSRALNALKEAGKTAFEEAIDHPIAKVLVAGLEGYLE